MFDSGESILRLTRARAVGALALLVGLLAWGLVDAKSQLLKRSSAHPSSDILLYRAIAKAVAHGKGYYQSAIDLQYSLGYPTSPQVTVRLPTLAELIGLVGPSTARLILAAIISTTIVLYVVKLRQLSRSRFQWYVGLAGFALSAGLYLTPNVVYMHEVWAGSLISLALVLRTDARWWPAVVLGILAACFRETAIVYGAVMGVLALWQRRWSEAAAWAAGALVFFGYLAWHLHQVDLHQVARPLQSPGWLAVNGWPFIVESVQPTSVLLVVPIKVAAVIVPFALLGLFFLRNDQMALRLLATVLGFCLVFFFVGRNNNIYWGMLYSPLVLIGLGFAPYGVVSLARALRRPPDC